jgi:hypothetical protein
MMLLALGWASALQAAEPKDIAAPADRAWRHEASGFAFPPRIGAFVRRDIKDLSGGKQIDLGSAYRDQATGTLATVYIYRPAMPLAPLWFDVANWYIRRNMRFAPVTPWEDAKPFAVAGQSQSADLRQVYAIGAVGRSSGVAVVPLGQWLVKVRMTSSNLEPRALDAILGSFVQALGWPDRMPPAAAANPVASCSGTLPEARAAEVRQDSAIVLIGASLGTIERNSLEKGEQADAPRICRDDSRTDNAYPIYQLDDGAGGFAIAIGDNGTLVAARPDPLSAELIRELGPDKNQKAAPFYRVTLMTPERWEQYSAFSQLPSVEQAFEVVRAGKPLSSNDMIGQAGITIDAAAIK